MQIQGEPATGRDIAAFVFGVLGLTALPCVGPILAIVLASGQKNGMARAGLILGWIALGLYALMAAAAVAFLLVGGTLANFGR
jgi:cytochrome c biogenesis protein CcdA